jgi:glycosyltransferase involved in cell wall biosynthesis
VPTAPRPAPPSPSPEPAPRYVSSSPALSVVVPVFNEEDNVEPLVAELRAVLDGLGEPFELVFVNDGSTDATGPRLAALAAAEPRLRVVALDGNFGEASALSAGLHQARGDVIVTLDGDGQNDPADIPRLLAALRERNLHAVSGRRVNRQEGYWIRVLPSRIANALIVRVTGIPVHDCGCGLKAYRRSAVPRLHLPRGLHRFIPAIFGVRADQVGEIDTRDRRRQHGESHYGLSRTLAVLRDLLAVRFIIADARATEWGFALATAGAAALGAFVMRWSVAAMIACDGLAILLGTVWWNARRFNRAQETGVYRLREEAR